MLKKSLFYLLGDSIVVISQFAILVIISKFYSIEELGYFTYFLAIIAPISYLIQMQHRTVYVTDAFPVFKISEYLMSRTILFIVYFSISTIFLINNNEEIIIFILIFIWKFSEMQSDLIYGYWQKENAISKISKSKLIRSVFQISIFSLFTILGSSLEYALLMITVTTFLILFYELYTNSIRLRINLNLIEFKRLLIFTFPLAVYSTLSVLYLNIPKYIIEYKLSVEEVAVYSTIAYFLVAGNLFINSLIQVRLKKISEYFENDVKKFTNEILKVIYLVIFFVVSSIIFIYYFGEIILQLIYNQEISEYNDLLMLLIFGTLFSYSASIIGVALTIAKEYKIQQFLSAIWCITHLILSYIFISEFKLLGAGYAFVISSVFQTVTSLYFFRMKIGIKFQAKKTV